MRVAQNEYAGLQIRCMGLAGPISAATIECVAEELLAPDDEREIFMSEEHRHVFRVQRGILDSSAHQAPTADTSIILASRKGHGRNGLTWATEAAPRARSGRGGDRGRGGRAEFPRRHVEPAAC